MNADESNNAVFAFFPVTNSQESLEFYVERLIGFREHSVFAIGGGGCVRCCHERSGVIIQFVELDTPDYMSLYGSLRRAPTVMYFPLEGIENAYFNLKNSDLRLEELIRTPVSYSFRVQDMDGNVVGYHETFLRDL